MHDSKTDVSIERLQRALRWWKTVAILALAVLFMASLAGVASLVVAGRMAAIQRMRAEEAMQIAEQHRQEAVAQREQAVEEKTLAERAIQVAEEQRRVAEQERRRAEETTQRLREAEETPDAGKVQD